MEEGQELFGHVGVPGVHGVVRGVVVGIGEYLVGWLWGVWGWKVYGRWYWGMVRGNGKWRRVCGTGLRGMMVEHCFGCEG
jgi:hypothetical protein